MRANDSFHLCALACLLVGIALGANAEPPAAATGAESPAASAEVAAPIASAPPLLGSARYGVTPAAVYVELAEMAGGARRVAQRARHHLPKEPEQALLLAEIALAASPRDPAVLRTMRETLKALQERARLGERFEGEGSWLDERKAAIEKRMVHRGPR